MSKKTTIILIVTIVGLSIGGFVGYLYLGLNRTEREETIGKVRSFLPFGQIPERKTAEEKPGVAPTGEPGEEGVTGPAPAQRLRKLIDSPVAGAVITETGERTVLSEAGTPQKIVRLVLRYAQKSDGKIFEKNLDDFVSNIVSGTVIPDVEETVFDSSGNRVIMRKVSRDGYTIQSYLGEIKQPEAEEAGPGTLSGEFLPDNLSQLVVSPNGEQYFHLLNYDDSVVGTVVNFKDSKKTQVFSSAFTEWLAQWVNSKTIFLTTKPSSSVPGHLYAIDAQNKLFMKVFGDISGLTTLVSPSGKKILYSQSENRSANLKIFDTEKKDISDLGIKGLPEKCAWAQDNITIYCLVPKDFLLAEYPDDWYQGLVSFNDLLWKINTSDKTFSVLVDPSEVSGEQIDGIRPFIDSNENFFFFYNKSDLSLWMYSLK